MRALRIFRTDHLLIVSRFTYSLSYHLILPTMGIMLTQAPYGFGLKETSYIVGMFALADRGLALLGAPLARKIDSKSLQVGGFCIAGFMCILISAVHLFALTLLATIGIGLGLSLSGIGARTYLAALPNSTTRLRGFSRMYIAINLGGVLGVIAVFLTPFREYNTTVFATAGFLYFASALVVMLLPHIMPHTSTHLSLRSLFVKLRASEGGLGPFVGAFETSE